MPSFVVYSSSSVRVGESTRIPLGRPEPLGETIRTIQNHPAYSTLFESHRLFLLDPTLWSKLL